jgi:hypothetical protein
MVHDTGLRVSWTDESGASFAEPKAPRPCWPLSRTQLSSVTSMPRFAIGDLTIDLDVPANFACEYGLNGALVALERSTGAGFEVSAINAGPGQGVPLLHKRATEAKVPLHHDTKDLASFFGPPATWLAGFGPHLIIATLRKPELQPQFAQVLESLAPAHDPFPEGVETATSPLRPSHTRWFEQRRTSLLEAERWSPQSSRAAEKLDDFWASLIADPPAEGDLLNTMLSGITVGFGELLRAHGFEWCVAKDPWGIAVGMVALKGTANMVVIPDAFVAKRWERQEPRFIADSVRAIAEQVARARVVH